MFDITTWIELGNNNFVDYIFSADFLTIAILIIMTSGSFIVLNFVYVEMWDDKEGTNFVILLIAFLAFMSILASSGNLFTFYLGWEGISLISLFLINFWSERARAIKATLKVYTVNKIGDFLILISILFIFISLGSTEFIFLNTMSLILNNYNIVFSDSNTNLLELSSILFITGGGVKSAQFGFHIWLLEAMEAPLGASALMHSSTLVVAGITLTYKLAEWINYSNWAHYILIAWGSWTAFFASFIACWQFELKIILAYSTVSSMGFLYYLLGLSAHIELFLYLIIHAYIKIFLFLAIGAIILHCNGCQDMRWMGNLLLYIPNLYIYYTAGSLGLAGVPYWSGYYCKSKTWTLTTQTLGFFGYIQIAVLLTILCTYIYLIRTGFVVFLGSKNGHISVYKKKYQSLLILIMFTILMLIVSYSGIIWTQMCNTMYNDTLFLFTHYYNLTSHLTNWISYFNWWNLITTYMSFLSLIFFLILILLNNPYDMTKTWIYIVISYTLFINIYTCI